MTRQSHFLLGNWQSFYLDDAIQRQQDQTGSGVGEKGIGERSRVLECSGGTEPSYVGQMSR